MPVGWEAGGGGRRGGGGGASGGRRAPGRGQGTAFAQAVAEGRGVDPADVKIEKIVVMNTDGIAPADDWESLADLEARGAEKLAESFARSFELPVVTVRPFNTFGPRQSTRAVIPTIITQLLDDRRIRLGSLHPRRDFTFVDDTVARFLRAADVLDLPWHPLHLRTGRDVSVGEVL